MERAGKKNGLKGIHFIGRLSSVGSFKIQSEREMLVGTEKLYKKYLSMGYEAINTRHMRYASIKSIGYFTKMLRTLLSRTIGNITVERYDYNKVLKYFFMENDKREDIYPQLVPRWDKTPRKGRNAEVYYNCTPENFGKAVDLALDCVKDKQDEHKIIFLFAWNEWGEGAYMEPDNKYGRGHLEMLKRKLLSE